MTDWEHTWNASVQIKTTVKQLQTYLITPMNRHHTVFLERLASSGFFGKNDVVLDYGCEKGRVSFFLSYQTNAKAIGIEYVERM